VYQNLILVIYTNIHKYTQMYTNVHKCTQMYTNIHKYTQMYTNIHKYTQIYRNIHKYTQIYTNVHKYTQIYTNTQKYTQIYTNIRLLETASDVISLTYRRIHQNITIISSDCSHGTMGKVVPVQAMKALGGVGVGLISPFILNLGT
jgi:hypothetical protein